jgi:glyoxylase-like metal-dependent hydrolase (beta-lactamase superfamily II)
MESGWRDLWLIATGSEAVVRLTVINAEEQGFLVTATIVTGDKEALVVNAGYTRADALRIAAAVLDSGKELKTIFISSSDPDYYFGTDTLQSIFPDAQIVATPAVVDEIKALNDAKLKIWVPQMGANAPRAPIIPRPLTNTTLNVDGQAVEIRGTIGVLASRPYVWIPSTRAVIGGVGLFSNVHVWTAGLTAEQQQSWLMQLDDIAALNPVTVVAGHMKPGSPQDQSVIAYTRAYLEAFLTEAPKAKDAKELIVELLSRYPNAALSIALIIGAKVAKGEMVW